MSEEVKSPFYSYDAKSYSLKFVGTIRVQDVCNGLNKYEARMSVCGSSFGESIQAMDIIYGEAFAERVLERMFGQFKMAAMNALKLSPPDGDL
jgi:hypothetical protein